MWIDFMREALDDSRLNTMLRPTGIIDVRINPKTGLVADTAENSIFEKFRIGFAPQSESDRANLSDRTIVKNYSDTIRENPTKPEPIF
jgi:penicillin-binding protein 1A